jgi:hypothetical protein
VASGIGQIVTLLDRGRLGELVTPGDPHDLASAVQRVMAQPNAALQRARVARHRTLAFHGWSNRAADIIAASHHQLEQRRHAMAI